MRGILATGVIALGLLWSAAAAAGTSDDGTDDNESAQSVERTISANANFTDSVAIAVPASHGLEPPLALKYDSGGGDGFVGVGWRLSGLSVIERASIRFGAPRYDDTTDVFLLDGDELVACAQAPTSASCTTGGTHTTRNESYLRIKRIVGTPDQWEVTGRSGTKMTYQAIATWGTYNAGDPAETNRATKYRWLLASVTDTHGNAAQYSYTCDGVPDCYISAITYNGNTIKFYREARTDAIAYGAGAGMGQVSSRLKTIEVKVGSQLVRAYALTYGMGTATQRSRLVSVQQFGSDATVDQISGAVSGATSLPPIALTDSEGTNAFQFADWLTDTSGGAQGSPMFTGDFDGDGRADIALPGGSCSIVVWHSNGTSFAKETWSVGNCTSQATDANFAADLNGDGIADLINFAGNTSSVYLSTGTGSTGTGFTKQSWSSAAPTSTSWVPADVNGDGKMDFAESKVTVSGSNCSINVRLSTGTNFTAQPRPVTPCAAASTTVLRVGDFNGDGRSDLYNRVLSQGHTLIRVYFTTTAGTFNYTSWLGGLGGPYTGEIWNIGDPNGDGNTDIIRIRPNDARVLVSDGAGGFQEQLWITQAVSFSAIGFRVGDINGDRRDDVVWATATDSHAYVSTGTAFSYQTLASYPSVTYFTTLRIGDFNGDGRSDLAAIVHSNEVVCTRDPDTNKLNCNSTNTKYRPEDVLAAQGTYPDLLTGITNRLGGTTTVAYTPSTAWPAATALLGNSFPPFVTQTVSSITANDGRGTVSTTNYAYSGPLWSQTERRFLGFGSSTATLPLNAGESAPPKIDTTYAQTLACAGAALTVKQKDGAGTVLRQGDETYSDNSTTLPYTCLDTESKTTVNVGGASKSAKVARTFDAYGNVATLTRHGDLGVSGDETTAEAVYQPNTAAYIVGLPARIRTYAGIGTGGAKLTENFLYYDGNTGSWQTAPVKGDATRTQAWLNTTGGYVTGNAGYDAYGNVTSQTDPLGNVTSLIYDATYHVFVTEARDPLYASDNRHKTTAAWDFVCAAPTQSVDLNALATTTQYDALCRPRKVTTPSGAFACTNYLSLGSPTAQNVETQTAPPAPESVTACDAAAFTPGANLWSRSYLDGFGRTYRAAAEGPGGTQTSIEALTAYNARGAVASATAPFYVNGSTPDTNYTTAWKYDALDRKIEKDHPDANKLLQSFGLSTIANGFEKATVTDELNRPHTVHTDGLGRSIRSDALLGAATVSTGYQYDLLDRLTGLTDAAGNRWTYSYDSLGRRLTVADPDLGNWSYVYDAAGRLTDQTDAKGQVTHLAYDALGRVLTKTAKYGTGSPETTTYTYDQARSGYYNVGHQTTASNSAAVIVYNFDNEGRQVGQTYTVSSINYSFAMAFDQGGRVLWQSYPDGDTVGSAGTPLAYDAAGRLKTVPNLIPLPGIIYDASGRQTNVTRQNGATTTMTWSPQRGWLNTLVTSSTAGTIQNYSYGRDALGRISGVTSPQAGDSWTYGYDDLDRLLSADNTTDNSLDQTFTYDLVGNMLTNSKVGTYSYPAQGASSVRPHAVSGVSGGLWGMQSFSYDANGSMTNEGADTRSYDGENRLVGATDGTVTTQFVYGPDGTRLKKTASGATTLYFGDDVEVIPGTTPQYTKYLPGDAKRVGLATTTWLHRDHLQSVRAITNSSGTPLDSADYRPFGDQVGFASVTESKGFIGQRQDDETQLMYLHARYYDPVLGRFIQADPANPVRPGVGINRFAYALNNPVVLFDSNGLEAEAYGGMDPSERDSAYGGGWADRGLDGRDPSVRERYDRAYAFTHNAYPGHVAPNILDVSEDGTRYPSHFPGGSEGIYVGYENDIVGGLTTHQPIEAEAAAAFERIARETGFDSMNVNSTTGGRHSATSLHYQGLAIDVNEINGKKIKDNPTMPEIAELQDTMAADPAVRENYGPDQVRKYDRTFDANLGQTVTTNTTDYETTNTKRAKDLVKAHKNHVHIGVYPQ